MKSYKQMVAEEAANNNDFSEVIYNITKEEYEKPFYHTDSEVSPFIGWSHDYVYFSLDYDNSISIKSVPRYPGVKQVKEHVSAFWDDHRTLEV